MSPVISLRSPLSASVRDALFLSLVVKLNERLMKVRSAQFRLNAKITMPRWKDRAGASDSLQEGFDMFSDYARAHENVHVKIGEAAAREMEKEVLAIAPQKDCATLEKKVTAVLTKVQAKHHKTQLAFDAAEDRRIRKLLAGGGR